MKVTLFNGNLQSQKVVPMDTLVAMIRNGAKSKQVEALRSELAYTLPGCPAKKAGGIPAVVFAAELEKQAGVQVLSSYSGTILLNVGNLANQKEAQQIRQLAAESLQTRAAFVGSGGRSVKIVVSFTLPDGALPQSEQLARIFHAHAYRRAAAYYREQLQREIGNEPSTPEAACRLSHDPHIYYNPQALAIRIAQPWQMPDSKTHTAETQTDSDPLLRLAPGEERSRIISLLFETAFSQAQDATGYTTSRTDIKPFLIRLAENCLRSGIPEEEAIKWVRAHAVFLPFEAELRATFRNVYNLPAGFGLKPCIRPEQVLALQTSEFMKRRYEFRHNVLKDDVEFRERKSYYYGFFPMDERALNSISINAQSEGIPLWDRDVKRYVYSDRVPKYSPIEAFLNNLPTWDGVDRIRPLADTLPSGNTAWRGQFYTWFLSLVAHWTQMDNLHANSASPLLVGKQGCGKSTWCRNLLPPELRDYFTDSIDFSKKREAELSLSRFVLINIDEFDAISPSHQAFLKHILQKPVVNARQLYKRTVQSLRRYASFVATSNNFDLLSDPTGSRRFICIEIKGTVERLAIDYQQLYAQATTALRSGERYWFTTEEEAVITHNNREFMQISIEEQQFFQYFRIPEAGETGKMLSAAEILGRIETRSHLKSSIRNMAHFGRILLKNKVPNQHTRTGNYYHVIER